MLADPGLTRRILDNLIDNGIRHTPTGSRLRVRASRDEGGWLLEVSDQGPGIPAAQRGRVFERFGRSDSARARQRRNWTGPAAEPRIRPRAGWQAEPGGAAGVGSRRAGVDPG